MVGHEVERQKWAFNDKERGRILTILSTSLKPSTTKRNVKLENLIPILEIRKRIFQNRSLR